MINAICLGLRRASLGAAEASGIRLCASPGGAFLSPSRRAPVTAAATLLPDLVRCRLHGSAQGAKAFGASMSGVAKLIAVRDRPPQSAFVTLPGMPWLPGKAPDAHQNRPRCQGRSQTPGSGQKDHMRGFHALLQLLLLAGAAAAQAPAWAGVGERRLLQTVPLPNGTALASQASPVGVSLTIGASGGLQACVGGACFATGLVPSCNCTSATFVQGPCQAGGALLQQPPPAAQSSALQTPCTSWTLLSAAGGGAISSGAAPFAANGSAVMLPPGAYKLVVTLTDVGKGPASSVVAFSVAAPLTTNSPAPMVAAPVSTPTAAQPTLLAASGDVLLGGYTVATFTVVRDPPPLF